MWRSCFGVLPPTLVCLHTTKIEGAHDVTQVKRFKLSDPERLHTRFGLSKHGILNHNSTTRGEKQPNAAVWPPKKQIPGDENKLEARGATFTGKHKAFATKFISHLAYSSTNRKSFKHSQSLYGCSVKFAVIKQSRDHPKTSFLSVCVVRARPVA